MLAGLVSVLEGAAAQFEIEYPCHSPEAEHWFVLQAVPLDTVPRHLLVMHRDVTRRKAAELALGERCALLQQTLDTVETIIVALDCQGMVTMINRCGAQLLGREVDEIVGTSWFETCLPQPEGREQVYPVFRRILEGDLARVEYFENEILTADGSRRMVAWHNACVRDADGQICGTLAAGTDITGQKRMERALHESNREMRRAQEIGQIGSWWLDGAGDRLTWSDETYRIFGVTPGSPLSHALFLDRVHPDDRASVDARWKAALAGAPYDIEHRVVVGDAVKWIRERAQLDFGPEGELLGGYGTAQDVTGSKLALLARWESERLLREAQETARIGTYVYVVDEDRWTCSAVMDDIFGIDAGFARTVRSWIMLVHPDDREMLGAYLAEVLAGRVPRFDKEYRVRRPCDGQVRWLHGYGRVDFDGAGYALRMVGTIMDITDRKQAEIALLGAQERYRRLFVVSPLPMWVFDEETLRFLEVNNAAIADYGYSREEFLAKSILDIRPVEDVPAVLACVRACASSTHGETWRHFRKGGELIDVAVWTESIEYEGRPARLVIAEDVTRRHELEAALVRKVELSEQLKNIAATVPGAIYAFRRHPDGSFSIPYIEGRQFEILGYPSEAFTDDASPLIGLILPDDLQAIRESIEVSARTMDSWHGVFRVSHPKLGLRWIEGNSVPQACPDGGVLWHGYLSDATERVLATQHLEQSHAQIQALAAHMEVVREEERTRIARELHDELGQTLTAIRMNLLQLGALAGPDNRRMNTQIKGMEAIVEEAMLAVRRISRELHPRILDTLGLAGAIEWETGEFRKRMGIRCRCVVPQEEMVLPEHFKTHVYRLFQEAMTNISRHAQATSVEVELGHDETALSLLVADNGIGISREGVVGNTLGLTGMKERASQIGGTLTIATVPSVRGTRIVLNAPLGVAAAKGAK